MKKIYALSTLICYLTFQAVPSFAQEITPATALDAYINNADKTFHWKMKESFSIGDVKAYNILLTSQQWHEFIWTHQLTILVPSENSYDGALLFITGGSNKKGAPNWNGEGDSFLKSLSTLASKNKGIVALLRQAPNQPLYGDLTEDALISFTLHKFKEDGDYSWPLLFPMVKSAVRAMDAVQEFAKQQLKHEVNRFVVSGASKRGWTTWLTGASDKRVAAIAPMVIDILNMPVNLEYQVKMWKDYSVQIEDYVKLGIPQSARSEKGEAITTMVDPYSYRKKLTMPKMLIMGTNDEYWTVDAIKNYIDSIPGQNLVHYVPNVGHDLGDKKQALAALSAFFGETISKQPYAICEPAISYSKKGITLKVRSTPDLLVDAMLWSTNSTDTDFRNDAWTGKKVELKSKTPVVTSFQAYPASGYRAFYLDLKYKDVNGGEYTESTRMYVADNDEVFVK
ncbi:MAG: PhoPQ-activated protein PqaA family protein [Chryseolinea sp.]